MLPELWDAVVLNEEHCFLFSDMARTLKYDLDSLGPALFENLIQNLLKTELGMSVEAWGGCGDYGRDAFSPGPLNYPTKNTPQPGPYVFQAKFVSQANVAGGKPFPLLMKAVKAEMQRIGERKSQRAWKTPKFYVLLTNVPLSADARNQVIQLVGEELGLKESRIGVQDALDVSNLVDAHPSVSRKFPFVVTPDAIQNSLFKVVHNEIIQRTDGTLKSAADLLEIFVPTSSYHSCWQKLAKYNFAVLEGPPEVGKTAIGWLIAAYQVSRGWIAVDCLKPQDFFDVYQPEEEQIFVADDAFGTTEYKVALGDDWGRHLHKIYPKLDNQHWLIWTTRTHILNTAVREMRLEGKAARFPTPGDVIVETSRISREEKAFMLYRHAKAGGLEDFAKQIVRSNAADIIGDPHFTPLRISRLVQDKLPALARQFSTQKPNSATIKAAIAEELKNPTNALRQAFRKLSAQQKWILLAVLDCARNPAPDAVAQAAERFGIVSPMVQAELSTLNQAFLSCTGGRIDWIHPSTRDLVIEEMELDPALSAQFLRKCSFEGIALAISHSGGRKGTRSFPLMNSDDAWFVLKQRFLEIFDGKNQFELSQALRVLLSALDFAAADRRTHEQLLSVAQALLDLLYDQFSAAKEPIFETVLSAFTSLSRHLRSQRACPDISRAWSRVKTEYFNNLENAKGYANALEGDPIRRLAKYAKFLQKNNAAFFDIEDFRRETRASIRTVIESVRDDCENEYDSDLDILEGESERFEGLSSALGELEGLFPDFEEELGDLKSVAAQKADELQTEVSSMKGEDEDSRDYWDDSDARGAVSELSIDEIFREL